MLIKHTAKEYIDQAYEKRLNKSQPSLSTNACIEVQFFIRIVANWSFDDTVKPV